MTGTAKQTVLLETVKQTETASYRTVKLKTVGQTAATENCWLLRAGLDGFNRISGLDVLNTTSSTILATITAVARFYPAGRGPSCVT